MIVSTVVEGIVLSVVDGADINAGVDLTDGADTPDTNVPLELAWLVFHASKVLFPTYNA